MQPYGTGGSVPPYVLPAQFRQQPPPYAAMQAPPSYGTALTHPTLPNGGVGVVHAAPPAVAVPLIRKKIDPTQIPECMMETKLHSDHKERDQREREADLYSIVCTLDRLERAFIADQVNTHDYESAATKLIAQYRALQEVLSADLNQFLATNELECKAACKRLSIGVPATVEHGLLSKKPGQQSKDVAECVQHFITAMDSLRLNMVAVDQLFPILNDLVTSLNKITSLSPDFEAKTKMKKWLTILSGKRASDELNEDEARQFLFDLESSHSQFYQSL